MSRRYGGIHFAQGDLDARTDGKIVGNLTFAKATALFHGGTTYPYDGAGDPASARTGG